MRPAFAGFASDYRATGSFGPSIERLAERLADPVADRVVEAALETMAPAAQTKGITVVPRLNAGVATVRGDFALPSREIGVSVRLLVDKHEHCGVSDRNLGRHFLRLEPELV